MEGLGGLFPQPQSLHALQVAGPRDDRLADLWGMHPPDMPALAALVEGPADREGDDGDHYRGDSDCDDDDGAQQAYYDQGIDDSDDSDASDVDIGDEGGDGGDGGDPAAAHQRTVSAEDLIASTSANICSSGSQLPALSTRLWTILSTVRRSKLYCITYERCWDWPLSWC